jgi:hypothetical protein
LRRIELVRVTGLRFHRSWSRAVAWPPRLSPGSRCA